MPKVNETRGDDKVLERDNWNIIVDVYTNNRSSKTGSFFYKELVFSEPGNANFTM